MKEKKLTDEEIVKALDICYSTPCCTNECPYFNKNGRNFCLEGKAFYKNLKDLINSQKAEIERLTEERLKAIIEEEYKNALKGKVVLTREEYDELQKGIKTYNYTAMFNAQDAYRWEQGYLQGTKETAEKFAKLVEFHSVATMKDNVEYFTISALGLKEILHEEFGVPYDEIAKEFTGDSNGH